MDATRLTEMGEAMYGVRWQTQLAADLGVSARHVRRWLSHQCVIPAWVDKRLTALAATRAERIIETARLT